MLTPAAAITVVHRFAGRQVQQLLIKILWQLRIMLILALIKTIGTIGFLLFIIHGLHSFP